MITVLVPVGPHPANQRWLNECLASLDAQALRPTEVLLIDDSGDNSCGLERFRPVFPRLSITVYSTPWNLGVAHAFNVGVGLSADNLVFMLGSDDTLEPECIAACLEAYAETHNDDLGYYSVGVRYMDTGETQTAPCHAAMVTKRLWRHTGGFPVQSASGAPDAALLSILFAHGPRAGRIYPVRNGAPLYNYRRHAETDTASKAPWQGVILSTRDLVTSEWRPRDA